MHTWLPLLGELTVIISFSFFKVLFLCFFPSLQHIVQYKGKKYTHVCAWNPPAPHRVHTHTHTHTHTLSLSLISRKAYYQDAFVCGRCRSGSLEKQITESTGLPFRHMWVLGVHQLLQLLLYPFLSQNLYAVIGIWNIHKLTILVYSSKYKMIFIIMIINLLHCYIPHENITSS